MYLSKLAQRPVRELCFLMWSSRRVRVSLEERHGQVSWQNVVEGGNIGRTLDGCVSAQRQNSAARAANISQQQLQNRGGADNLHPVRMLGPAYGVADRARLVRTRRGNECFRRLQKYLSGNAAAALHHLGRVAGEVPLQDLEDAIADPAAWDRIRTSPHPRPLRHDPSRVLRRRKNVRPCFLVWPRTTRPRFHSSA